MAPETTDWDAPLNADGDARMSALRDALRLDISEVVAWHSELHASFSSDAWGYPQIADISDVELRAIVADQLLGSVDGLLDGLTDAGIAVHQFREIVGPNGVKYSDADESLNDMLVGERLRGSVAAFFDAVGTSLDCLAAALIVVVRAPLAIQRADFASLTGLNAGKDHAKHFPDAVPSMQIAMWEELLSEIHHALAVAGPDGWLRWALETRNALTHRGKATTVFLPRPISGRLLVPPTNRPQALYRYDMHLRRRPWLPGMEGFLSADGFQNAWLDEPADRTIAGIQSLLCGFCDRMAAWAMRAFNPTPQADLLAPAPRWRLPVPPDLSFNGIAPGGTVPIAGASGGMNAEQVRLAERLRQRRASNSNP